MLPQSESALNLPNELRLVHNLWPISVGRCRNPNYSTYDRELLAMVAAIRHFRHHLLGTRFTLRSDHRPLQFLQTTKDPWGRRARWLEDLQQYHFTLEHVKGTQNPFADALSRTGDTVGNLRAPHTPTPTPLDWTPWTQDSFLQAQHDDDDNLHDVLTYLRLDQQPPPASPPYSVSWKNR